MIRNFFVTAIRIAYRNKLISFLNILGMALGLAVSLILILHIRYELSYDKQIPDSERVFRLHNHGLGEDGRNWATTSTPLFYALPEFFPEIEYALRLVHSSSFNLQYEREDGELAEFEESGAYYADSTVFDVLGIDLIRGDKNDFYEHNNGIVISESMAERYFGDEDPIGKDLKFTGSDFFLTVKGLMPDCPENSHMDYTFFMTFKSFRNRLLSMGYSDLFFSRGWAGVYNYIKLHEKADPLDVIERLDDFTISYYTPVYQDSSIVLDYNKFSLMNIRDIHLKSRLEEEIRVNGNYTYIMVFIISVFFILIVVATNYINMASSLALKRTKEIGIKKINGSGRALLQFQIILESLLTTFLGGILAVLLIDLLLPGYNMLAGQDFELTSVFRSENLFIFLAMVIGLGFLSGIYPAFFITGYKPVDALKGTREPGGKTHSFRQFLLIFQFAISVFMIFATLGIYTQMKFFQNKNLGFEKENLVSIESTGDFESFVVQNPETFKNELKKLPAVMNVAYCSNIPGERLSVEMLKMPDYIEGEPMPSLRFIRVCRDYVNTLGLNLVEGNGFTSMEADESRFILSEMAVRVLDLDEPIGQHGTSMFGGEGIITGVIEDYHFASLHQPIEPVVLEYNTDELRGWTESNVLIRLYPGNLKEQVNSIENKIKELVPTSGASIGFVDDYLDSLYVSENKMSMLFKAFTIFTIIISCLGLFGITAYNAELKTKEIGIRKVMGASSFTLVKYLSLRFVTFIIISVIIAFPCAIIFLRSWKQNFAYQADQSVLTWIIAIVISLAVALMTVVFHAVRTASRKPADVLKYE